MSDSKSQKWLESAKKTVTVEFGPYKSLSFVLSNPKHNQLALDLVISMVDYSNEDPYIGFNVYNLQPTPQLPDILPSCGYFNGFEMMSHTGPLVCFDPASWVMASSVICADIYYYVYDINALRAIPANDQIWTKLRQSKFISRSPAHTKVLNAMGIQPIAEQLDLNMKGLKKIIYG